MKSTFFLTLIVPMLAITGCEKKTATEVPHDKLAAEVIQDKLKGALTRELAAEILNKHLSTQFISRLKFIEDDAPSAKQDDGYKAWIQVFGGHTDGLYRAKQDGIVEQTPALTELRFTEKGLKLVGNFIKKNELGLFFGFDIFLKNPIGQRVDQVTGITEGGHPSTKVVEYVTEYLIPPTMRTMKQYVFGGSKETAAFQKYDDGWRLLTQ